MGYPINDMDFKDTTIEKVEPHEGGYTVTRDDGWAFGGISNEDAAAAGVVPKVGDRARFYGTIGHPVRGVFINGVRIYYRTPAEQQARHAAEVLLADDKKQRELDASRPDRDARRAALPKCFQRRLSRFESANRNWRRDFEPYEMSCCEDAVKIADALKTADEIRAFGKLSWDEQNKRVPGLFDGHSGNSFGMAVRLAYHYATDPENVVQEHGALCALVGCSGYGDSGKVRA